MPFYKIIAKFNQLLSFVQIIAPSETLRFVTINAKDIFLVNLKREENVLQVCASFWTKEYIEYGLWRSPDVVTSIIQGYLVENPSSNVDATTTVSWKHNPVHRSLSVLYLEELGFPTKKPAEVDRWLRRALFF